MKILIIASTVAEYISVGNIAKGLYALLEKGGKEVKLVYLDTTADIQTDFQGIGNRFEAKVYHKLAIITNYRYRHRFGAEREIKRIIKEYDPDIIHLVQVCQVYIDYEKLFKIIRDSGKICVYTMIDEEPYLGDCDNAYACGQFMKGCEFCKGDNEAVNRDNHNGKWSNHNGSRRLALIKQKAYGSINKTKMCFVAPQWVVERAKKSKLLQGHHFYIIDEYVDNHYVYFPRKDFVGITNRYKIDTNKILILNIAKYSNVRKGIGYYIDLARRLEDNDLYQFIHVGYDGEKEILPTNYIPIPFLKNQDELARLLSAADLYITTSISDTMPNVCLEALSCGTPICGFNITGIPYVAEEPMGIFVEAGNIQELEKVVLCHYEKKQMDISWMCREYAIKRYSPETYGKRMLEVYEDMINRNSGCGRRTIYDSF